MFTITKTVLLTVLTAATTTANELGRIVGGDEAKAGDYPYFVEMGGCGGALIAPDMVLFAAHCDDWKDKQVNIGAYKKRTIAEGSQARFCDEWRADPKFGTGGSSINYDFALCKLNEPVTIDSDIKLELNDKDSVPKDDKNLLVMGLGALEEGGGGPDTLQDVKVPAISNEKCNSKQYYDGEITDIMLCAGFDEGQKDSCQGDSGGPLVRRKKNDDGTFTDTHVGVVSWGYGCAREKTPGVYARTSKRVDWIKNTSCNMGSIADFCDNDPAPAPTCSGDALTVKLTTDQYGYETSWTLKDNKNKKIMTRKYLIDFYANEHELCLESDTCYDFILEDSYGDGMCYQGECGSYSLTLNGEEIKSGVGNFNYKRTIEFCTGDGSGDDSEDPPTSPPSSGLCEDIPEFEFNFNPNKTCEDWVGVGKTKKIKKKCRKNWLGYKVFDWCPKTCGEVGLGFCAN